MVSIALSYRFSSLVRFLEEQLGRAGSLEVAPALLTKRKRDR